MPENTLPFGNRVRTTRKALGLSQHALAILAGMVHGQQVNRIESVGNANLNTAVKLADALGVSLDYLTGRSDGDAEIERRIRILDEIEALKAQLQ